MRLIPTQLARTLLYVLAAAGLTGCLDSVPTETNPLTEGSNRSLYSGPAPATADVQAFMTNLWENINSNNRCGSCHGAGGQSPEFARTDDVNLAYSAAIQVADLASPEDSTLVSKVAGGHNCWLDSDAACGAVMTAYIEAWAGGSVTGSSNEIELEAPVLKDPGDTKNFPDDSALFAANVHPLLTAHCAECHTESAAIPQSPYFASADVDAAYEAVRTSQKIDLDTSANSRLVVRLRQEFHNCWTNSCSNDADAMQAAIQAFADGVPLTQIDPDLVVSKALNLADGIVAAGGSRYENNVVALYEFKTGSGATLYDTSGVEPALDLTLTGTEDVDYQWVGGWGIEFISGRAQGTTAASGKLADFIQSTGEYSIEAWVVPANVTQEGPARIISYSAGLDARNFTLGQTLYNYGFLQRSSTTDGNGEPALSTADADEDLQATQQHVVVTFDPVNGRRIYVNGAFTDDEDSVGPGNFNDWDDSFAFVMGDEVGGERQWQGKLRLVAIHNRALTTEQVQQNFEAGVGEKFYLLFSVSHLIDVADSYILFEVSQFDSYSYLFNAPKFVSLDPDAAPDNIPVQGMRIGINGKEPTVGQAYRNLDVTLNTTDFTASGQVLSSLGTIIALEKGVDTDEFFLTFERLGDQTNVVVEAAPTAAAAVDLDPASDIGLRTFDEINASMSEITGVSTTQSDVQSTFETIKQQLPTVENVSGFLASHHVAVSQLAIEYCNALVEDTTLRANFFPGFNFGAGAATAFDTAGERSLIIDPLMDKVMGTNLTSQPDTADVEAELTSLINNLSACGGGCAADRTETVVKAACAATLGSAALLIQ